MAQLLHSLLFTDSRDFLLDKESAHIKADAIRGKVVGLIIGPLRLPPPFPLIEKPCEQLLHAVAFVYVPLPERAFFPFPRRGWQLDTRPDEECFKDVLQALPQGCLAVPVDDSVTREKIAELYHHKSAGNFSLVFVGPDGRLHSDRGLALLKKWGSEGYPFDDERIATLQNLQVLLAHEGRDELISSADDGGQQKIKVIDIQGKTVGLFFSAHWCYPCQRFTPVLASMYKQLKGDFEVVFVSSDKDQESFDSYFKEMPWLAVPYDDEKTRKFLRDWFEVDGIPTLVILDKRGKTLNTEGVDLVKEHGLEAFPFTSKSLEHLQKGKRRALKQQEEEGKRAAQTLQSLLVTDERDFVTSKHNTVKVSSLAGKTVGLYFSEHWCAPCRRFTSKLKSVYEELQGRGEEFEVIVISGEGDEESFNEGYSSMPIWLALPFKDKSIKTVSDYFAIGRIPKLVIIGPDGKTVTTDGDGLISVYGADAFPFSEGRLTEMIEKLGRLPKQVNASKHEHALILATAGEVYRCSGCGEQGVGQVYHCAECCFDLHPSCVVEAETKTSGARAAGGEGADPGYVCEGDVCCKI